MKSPSHELDKQVQELLDHFASGRLGHFIGGEWHKGHSLDYFTNHSPVDWHQLGQLAAGNREDISDAAEAAESAFDSWQSQNGAARHKLLMRIGDEIEKRADTIACIETMDTGQPIRYMKRAVLRGAENFRFFARKVFDSVDGRSYPTQTHDNLTTRTPLGPVGIITPWNTPFLTATWKIAPALAAGCTVVHKPAEWSPLSAALLVNICADAGLPEGVLNLVNGSGETAGRELTENDKIKGIAFVGESATGSKIQRQSAGTLKRLSMELGGKNPIIVFADADLERALDSVLGMCYSLNGQRCTSASRLLVEEDIKVEFCERIASRIGDLCIGDPLNPAVDIGPLIHPQHWRKVMNYLDSAAAEGAQLVTSGKNTVPGDSQLFVAPTFYADVHPDSRLFQEEIFGPVLTATDFRDEQQATVLANHSNYGLAAYLWTGSGNRAHRMARRLNSAMIWINSDNVRHLSAPFGGMKASGIGREGGDYSFDFFMETKNICFSLQ